MATDERVHTAPTEVTVGCVNFLPVYGDSVATLAKIETWVRAAAGRGCDLVVFPEGALTSWSNCDACRDAAGPCAWHRDEIAETVDGPSVQRVAALCAELDLYVIVGFIERDPEHASTLYNAVAVVAPEGVLGTYRKIHLGALPATTEGLTFAPGAELPVWPTRFGLVGIAICFDFWFNPEIPRLLALKGARLLVNPTASMSPPDQIVGSTLTRTRENISFVAVANLVGSPGDPSGDHFSGHSIIAGPSYPDFVQVLAAATDDEELIVATVDLGEIDRWSGFFPWREWRAGRLAGASELIAAEFAALRDAARVPSTTSPVAQGVPSDPST
jgi:predicted amidohydrolase